MSKPINDINNIFEFSQTPSDIEFYSTQIMQRFLISTDINKLKQQSISKLLTLFIWIGKSSILSDHSRSFLEESLKELFDDFYTKDLFLKLKYLLNFLKNHNSKIHILEHLFDLEEKFQDPLAQKETTLKTKILEIAENLKTMNSQIKIMETERSLKEIKTLDTQELKKADQKISVIINSLKPAA